ncbi:MAG: hypothetical protein GY731_08000 [Gammaproteobacteria bacterium]|nr:hypothetical protein [Gammaproteobacteria bacterium]
MKPLPSYRRRDPYECPNEATKVEHKALQSKIGQLVQRHQELNGVFLCFVAELMKRAGDYRAVEYYQAAITADPSEPAFELFYGNYLQHYRGAKRPFTVEARQHYRRALKKLAHLDRSNRRHVFDDLTEKYVKRSIIAAQKYDGLPLLTLPLAADNSADRTPVVFFGTNNIFRDATSNIGEVDDARKFTSEALFAESDYRLGRPLTRHELRVLVRDRRQFETLNRLRMRYGQYPVVDLFYREQRDEDAAISNSLRPSEFNDVDIQEVGVAIEKTWDMAPYFDFFVRGEYRDRREEGAVEFFPKTKEETHHLGGQAAISKYIGSDQYTLGVSYAFEDIEPGIEEEERRIYATDLTYKSGIFDPDQLTLGLGYVLQDIKPGGFNLGERDRRIYYGNVSYLFGPKQYRISDRGFPTGGIEITGGIVRDENSYSEALVSEHEVYLGVSVRRLKLFEKLNTFDITLRPTVYKSEVDSDPSQDNAQYRTNLTLLYRIRDEQRIDKVPSGGLGVYPAYVHLEVPFRHDVAIDGPDDFENFRIGVMLKGEFFIAGRALGPAITASLGYEFQRFYKLDKDLHLFGLRVGMGF